MSKPKMCEMTERGMKHYVEPGAWICNCGAKRGKPIPYGPKNVRQAECESASENEKNARQRDNEEDRI